MNLIFASNNTYKLREVSAILNGIVTVKSLDDAGISGDIAETGTTLEENAFIKADYVYRKTGQDGCPHGRPHCHLHGCRLVIVGAFRRLIC